MQTKNSQIGYLPDENPPVWKLLLFAIQQIVVMFPATVLVALLTGFHVSTTIFASGLATICFILITGRKIPLYYGSSFSYIAAISSITAVNYGEIAPDEKIAAAQIGIMLSGLISIGVGLLIKKVPMEKIEKVLPPTVTGSIALIIGVTLAGSALSNVTSLASTEAVINAGKVSLASGLGWLIALVTMLSTICFSVFFKKGFKSQIPILLGLVTGYLFALILDAASGIDFVNFNKLAETSIFTAPHFTFPWQADSKLVGPAILAIMPIAIATIPESTAHVFQLDIYVNELSESMGKKRYNIADKLGLNLIGDGVGDIVSAFVGGPAGTNYGENISTMSITKNFSTSVLMAAAGITMLISFFTPLTKLVYSIPDAVIGGLSIYLFGVIGAQGISIMISKGVNLFDQKSLAVIAVTLIIGIGGSFVTDPLTFGEGENAVTLPAIATAAIVGILLNLLLSIPEFIENRKAKTTISQN